MFVRLTGCPLRCHYCDTAYAFEGGEWHDLEAIVERVRAYATTHVCVTGGEPLAQKNVLPLLRALCDAGFRVSLETSGALPLAGVDPRVVKVVDVKTPGFGRGGPQPLRRARGLAPRDQVKFVICDRADYDWSREKVAQLGLAQRCGVLFSPSDGQLPARDLADWILADGLPVRFQFQLHKHLWGNVPGK